MLNKTENDVMNAIYTLCHEKGVCLISPAELLAQLPQRKKYTEEQLDSVLGELALDNYFELLSSERKGEKMYVISLRADGYGYKRNYTQMRRRMFLKIGWAIASAMIAFLVGWIMKWIF